MDPRSPLRRSTDAHEALSYVDGRRLAPVAGLARDARAREGGGRFMR
jgi:hypothetical protein